jgi:hypothetical protein
LEVLYIFTGQLKKTTMKKALKIIGVIFVIILIAGVIGNYMDSKKANVNVAIDLAKVMEMKIDSVILELGQPIFAEKQTGAEINANSTRSYIFRKGKYDLFLQVFPQSNRIKKAEVMIRKSDKDSSYQVLDDNGLDTVKLGCNVENLDKGWSVKTSTDIDGGILGLNIKRAIE